MAEKKKVEKKKPEEKKPEAKAAKVVMYKALRNCFDNKRFFKAGEIIKVVEGKVDSFVETHFEKVEK